jgi:hydrogenase expression/formation protein HypC
MCIGIPMQVTAVEPGHAVCEGRGERRHVTHQCDVLSGDAGFELPSRMSAEQLRQLAGP